MEERGCQGDSGRSWSIAWSNNFLGKVGTFQNILEVLVGKRISSNIASRNFQKSFAEASFPSLSRP